MVAELLLLAALLSGCDLPYQKLFDVQHASAALPVRIYVAVPDSNRVYALKISSDSLTRQYPVAGHPVACAVSPDGGELAVVSILTGTLTLLSLPGGELVARVPLDKHAQPARVAYTRDGGRIVVLLRGTDQVLVLNRTSRKPIATVAVDHHPYAMAISPDGHTAWIVSHEMKSLQVIDLEQGTVVKTVALDHDPYDVVLDPPGKRLYIPCYNADDLCIVDAVTDDVTAHVRVPGGPYAALCGQQGVYVSCNDAGTVHLVDPDKAEVLPQVAALDPGVGEMALSPLEDALYVTVSAIPHVSVVSTDTLQQVARVPLDGKAQGLATGN